MKLTDRQKASGLTLNDIVHVVLINDTTQDPNGSSYKADMQQIIDLVPKYWTSGSTGAFAIKTVNDSSVDATGDYAVASGFNTLASELYSFAEGHNTIAMGPASHAEGQNSTASGEASHAEGYLTVATEFGSHAEGVGTSANGYGSHVEGYNSTTSGPYSHAEGQDTITIGENSHAEGYITQAIGSHSHAEGTLTVANEHASHAEGNGSIASGITSHAEGYITKAIGESSHAQGQATQSIGDWSHAGGRSSIANGQTSFVHGDNSIAGGLNTIVLGANITGNTINTTYVDHLNIKTLGSTTSIYNLGYDSVGNVVIGGDKFISGLTFNNGTYDLTINRNDGTNFTQSLSILASDMLVTGGTYNPSNGIATFTTNSGGTFNVTGFLTGYTDTFVTGGTYSSGSATFKNTSGGTFTVTGFNTSYWSAGTGVNSVTTKYSNSTASGDYSLAEGFQTTASGYGSFAGGSGTTAGEVSFASGYDTIASGGGSFAMGNNTIASGDTSFAIGDTTIAGGYGSFASGGNTIALGITSFVTGNGGIENGYANFVTGAYNVITDGAYATAIGQFADIVTNNLSNVNDATNTSFIVGNGHATGGGTVLYRSTAFRVYVGGTVVVPSLSTALIAAESTGKVLVTREYLTGYSQTNLQKTITSSYTATSADNNYSIMINNGSNPITITIPAGLLSKINIGFIQQGSGDVTMTAGAGVTINTPIAGGYKIKGINYNAYVEQVNSSDVYQLLGNLKV